MSGGGSAVIYPGVDPGFEGMEAGRDQLASRRVEPWTAMLKCPAKFSCAAPDPDGPPAPLAPLPEPVAEAGLELTAGAQGPTARPLVSESHEK